MNIRNKLNFGIFLPSILICSLSVLVLLSLNPDFAKQQIFNIFVGLFFFFLLTIIDISVATVLWKQLFIFSCVLLSLTLLIGRSVKGSLRWITIGFFNFQPSELVKVFLILILANFFSNNYKDFRFKHVIYSIFIFLPLALLVFLQPDLGTALVFAFVFILLILQTNVKKTFLLIGLILIGFSSQPIWHSLKDYQKDRILVFIDPYSDPRGAGYNVIQSKIAVGSGTLFGKGFGHGTQSHLRFLPEYHTDFIFATFAEEWGFIGVSLLLILYAIIFIFILKLIGKLDDKFDYFVCFGIFGMLLFQVFVNIGMNIGVMPITGITLPLMSYGGSSMITTFASLGIVNNIWVKKVKGI